MILYVSQNTWLPRFAKLPELPLVAIAKGGVTSATVASVGAAAEMAWVEGPAMTGVATCKVDADGAVRLLVVPGNVGNNDLLMELVSKVIRSGHETSF